MRKDLKIGLAVGGVLLAVLVVYLVVTGNKSGQDQVVIDDQGTAAPEGSELAPLDGQDSSQPEPGSDEMAPPVEPPPVSHVAVGGSPGTGADTDAGVGAEDPLASGTGTGADATPAGSGDSATWPELLNGERKFVPLRTETPSPGNAGSADDASPFSRGADGADPVALADATDRGSLSDPFGSPGPTVGVSGAGRGRIADDSGAPRGGARTHVVQEGETYSSIAQAFYGNAKYWPAIEKANPNINPNRLRPNTVITLPDSSAVVKPAGASSAGTPSGGRIARDRSRLIDPAREYRVQSGDNLHRIAQRKFGDADRWEDIYRLNRDAIGADPARLKLDMVLKLPDPTARERGSR